MQLFLLLIMYRIYSYQHIFSRNMAGDVYADKLRTELQNPSGESVDNGDDDISQFLQVQLQEKEQQNYSGHHVMAHHMGVGSFSNQMDRWWVKIRKYPRKMNCMSSKQGGGASWNGVCSGLEYMDMS